MDNLMIISTALNGGKKLEFYINQVLQGFEVKDSLIKSDKSAK